MKVLESLGRWLRHPLAKARHEWKSFREFLRPRRGNRVIFVKNGRECVARRWFNRIPGLKICIRGKNCTVRLALPIVAKGSRILLCGHGTTVEIGSTPVLNYAKIECAGGSRTLLRIGRNVRVYHSMQIQMGNSTCLIGDNCTIASHVLIYACDNHPVFCRENGAIANFQRRPLLIGDHCWLCRGSVITKNAQIPNDTIVGLNAVVTRAFTEEHSILGGNPAAVMRTGVTWEEQCPYFWCPDWQEDGTVNPMPRELRGGQERKK
ncbi:MAG: acyltransferase [Puniceicoccales bacterium]|nr:acyltransferase [Puniceicoccales bacterium]